MYKPKALNLKAIPEDIYNEILKVQSAEKIKHNKQFSLESAVYKIIKSTVKAKP